MAVRLDPFRNIVNVGWGARNWTVVMTLEVQFQEFPGYHPHSSFWVEVPTGLNGVGQNQNVGDPVFVNHWDAPSSGYNTDFIHAMAPPPALEADGAPPWEPAYMYWLGNPRSISDIQAGFVGGQVHVWLNTPKLFEDFAEEFGQHAGEGNPPRIEAGYWHSWNDAFQSGVPFMQTIGLRVRAWPLLPTAENWAGFTVTAPGMDDRGVLTGPMEPVVDERIVVVASQTQFGSFPPARYGALDYDRRNEAELFSV